ncbi:OmpA family protein [Pseudooctadecabacter sp.]|uniref:OmpA family protein n=1 Tax=Pseudooctadecabacter sp. TaxID=1966338 RepID=UPI0025CC5E57|nr:OmpA family protein [Pseudooctadecabacter sp.]
MRKLIGILLLIAGTGGLAYWASAAQAVRIEQTIFGSAQGLADKGPERLTTVVSGRDVRVSGTVATAQDLERVIADFAAIRGVRHLDTTGLAVLPVVSPFVLRVLKNDAGDLMADGVLPSETLRAQLGRRDGRAFADLPLAAGVPDAGWELAVQAGLDGLADLPSGAMTLSDRTLTLTGEAATPDAKDAILQQVQALSDGYTFEDEITLLDDGQPLRLDVRRAEGMTRAFGKLPSDMAVTSVVDRFPQAVVDIVQARIPAGQTDWPTTAAKGLDALAMLDEGHLQITGQMVDLSGSGRPEVLIEVDAMLDGLPSTYSVVRSLQVADDGAPLRLTIDFTGASATATGKYPADFVPRAPVGVPLEDTGADSFLTSDSFVANADAGVAALSQLLRGQLIVTDDSITLTGEAASPQVGSVIDGLLEGARASVSRDITYVDDGSPAAWSLTYTADQGAAVEGRLPTTLALEDLSAALGVPVRGTPTLAAEDDRASVGPEVLTIAATVLPELEQLTLSADGTGTAIDLVTSPAVDIDLMATDLAERLPATVAFSIRPVDPLPQDGSARINASTGLPEVFLDGFWIPDLDFSTTLEGCTAQSRAILANGQISFLSGSARLDATSIRTINALAAVAKPCVEADLDLEVSGHTDASGDAGQNQILSQDRAETVRAALIARGVPARAITAIGFGADRPVADNDTPEGRTLNRRTEIDWFERGALRDP